MDDSQILQKQAEELFEILEDTVEFFCDSRVVSGEKVYVMMRAFSDLKLSQFPIDEDEEYIEVSDNMEFEIDNENVDLEAGEYYLWDSNYED